MSADAQFGPQCLSVFKGIGKALSQVNLYSVAHPAVKAQLSETAGMLAEILGRAPGGKLVYVIDGDSVVANGEIVGKLGEVPAAVANIFSRFKLQSVVFEAGVTDGELIAFCELGALRPEAAKGVNPGAFLKEKGASKISVNEAVYAKVSDIEEEAKRSEELRSTASAGADATTSQQAAALAAEAQPMSDDAESLIAAVNSQAFERTLAQFVASVIKDPAERVRVMEIVLQRLKGDIEKHVTEATQELRGEKTELFNEASRTTAVLGTMADGVVTVNDRGEVLMMNPEAEDLFGATMAESVGKGLPNLVKDEHMLTLSADMATPKDREVEAKVGISGSEDSKKTLRKSTVVVRNEAGKPVGMVSSLTDKTKQREYEKLEREFVAHVTHELRAPLTSIRAALEIMRDGGGSIMEGEQGKMMSSALRNSDRLELLINSILDFSKIESGQMTVFPKGVGSERIIQESFESMKPWADRKGLKLVMDVQPSVPPVMADKSRTIQVIVNLLSNAIKFSPRGGRIDLRAVAGRDTRKGFVHFFVVDQGPGIAAEDQEKVFEKFKQIASGEQHVGGTGLGLSIAKALVHMQGGEMWLESAVGKGASFQFTLPEYEIPADERAPKGVKGKEIDTSAAWWKQIFGGKS